MNSSMILPTSNLFRQMCSSHFQVPHFVAEQTHSWLACEMVEWFCLSKADGIANKKLAVIY